MKVVCSGEGNGYHVLSIRGEKDFFRASLQVRLHALEKRKQTRKKWKHRRRLPYNGEKRTSRLLCIGMYFTCIIYNEMPCCNLLDQFDRASLNTMVKSSQRIWESNDIKYEFHSNLGEWLHENWLHSFV